MNRPRIKQSVITSTRWFTNYFIANRYDFLLPLTRKQLDDQILISKTFKDDQTTTVVKLELKQLSLVLKRYNPRSFSHKLKRAFRRSRAERCWQMSQAFAHAGLNVAPPVFMYEDRFGPICKNAYFANEFMQGEELLHALPKMDVVEMQQVVEAFQHALANMKAHKLSHGDLKASNLLWVSGELFFIDLDAARQHQSMPSWQRANRRDRKRFLKNWRDNPELTDLFSWVHLG